MEQRRRPQLRPGLRRVWRDPTTLQVGLSPTTGAVLTGLRDGDDAVIAVLDGAHDLDQVHQVARAHAVPTGRVGELVALLDRAGLLVGDDPSSTRGDADRVDLSRLGERARRRLEPDAAAWAVAYDSVGNGVRLIAERAGRHVRVIGAGRLGSALVTTLAAAGVGIVTVEDPGVVRLANVLPAGAGEQDVGTARTQAVGRAVQRVLGDDDPTSGRIVTGRLPQRPADLVVVVADDVLDARLGDDLVRRDVSHLAVVCGADRVVVGPLVTPGRGPCWRCLDLHRRDRDPAWPHLVAQLIAGRTGLPARGETASATAGAGLAALQVLGFLDGQRQPASRGRTLELMLPDGLVERRIWRTHPACGCVRFPTRPDGAPRSARSPQPARGGATMRAAPGWQTMDA